jgi:hypothetical protein
MPKRFQFFKENVVYLNIMLKISEKFKRGAFQHNSGVGESIPRPVFLDSKGENWGHPLKGGSP